MSKLYTLPDGSKIEPGTPFEVRAIVDTVDDSGDPVQVTDTLKFPADWLAYATPDDLERMDIKVEEVPDPEPLPGTSPTPVTMTDLLINSLERQGIVTAEQAAQLRKDIIVG